MKEAPHELSLAGADAEPHERSDMQRRYSAHPVWGDRDPIGREFLTTSDAMSSLGEVVYAVRVGDLIKIGFSSNMAQRMGALNPTEILAFKLGNYADEQAIHRRLVDHVARGREWYYPTPGVFDVINEMRHALGMESIAA